MEATTVYWVVLGRGEDKGNYYRVEGFGSGVLFLNKPE